MEKKEIVIYSVIFVLLVILAIFELCRISRKGNIFARTRINKYPITIITGCYLIIGTIIFLCETGTDLEHSIILICLSVVGFLATIVGLIVTYLQVKRASNQFFGYYDFYTVADEMLSKNKGRKIQFHFTTPIPGHIALNKESLFKEFQDKLCNYSGEIELIIPSAEKIIEAYDTYEEKTISKVEYDEDRIYEKLYPTLTEKPKIISVNSFLDNIRGRRTKESETTIYTYDKDNQEAIENIYMSDGRLVVYAIPLHYLRIQDGVDKKVADPTLIGFVTTERGVVQALKDNFEKIKEESEKLSPGETYIKNSKKERQRKILKNMYSQYIKTPDYHEKEIKAIEQECTTDLKGKLLELAQDNFDGMASTNEIIKALDIKSSDNVLDIGSGFGGVSLAIANKMKEMSETPTGLVKGIEIQQDRVKFARVLSKKLEVSDIVEFECDYFPDTTIVEGQCYDKIVSVLAVLHFIDKEKTLKHIASLLKPGGIVVIEDYFTEKERLSQEDQKSLLETISIPNLMTSKKYLDTLKKKGVRCESYDLTEKWKEICKKRVEANEKNKAKLIELCGEDKVEKHIKFCEGVYKLYEKGVIHGIRIIGIKTDNTRNIRR